MKEVVVGLDKDYAVRWHVTETLQVYHWGITLLHVAFMCSLSPLLLQ